MSFLLAQVGQRAAELFAERISAIDMTPPQAGLLRAIASDPGQSQQALSRHFGLLPSRVVAFLDELEERGYVERRRNPRDRRLHALHLTPLGEKMMKQLSTLAREHEQELTAGLNGHQRDALAEALQIVADHQGLTAGVHPGYHTLPPPRKQRQRAGKSHT